MDNEQTVSKPRFKLPCAPAVSSGRPPNSPLSRNGAGPFSVTIAAAILLLSLLAQPMGKLLVVVFRQVAVIPALSAAGASACLLLMSRRICRLWSSGSL